MTRRIFIAGIAALSGVGNPLVLKALAAQMMPHHLILHGVPSSPFFELRTYTELHPSTQSIWMRHGLHPVWQPNGEFLFPFESLAAREQAWRTLSADPEWISIQNVAALKKIAIYYV